MGILKSGNYFHMYANSHVCVGLDIPQTDDYPHTDANVVICVGLRIVGLVSIPEPPQIRRLRP